MTTEQSLKKEYNTFVKGIITEAGPLAFPDNASLDEENCVLNREGSRQRRLGMDYEDNFTLVSATATSSEAVASYRWENAGSNVLHQLAVVQVGKKLYIFNAMALSTSGALITTLDLTGQITGLTPLGVASGMGVLFCTETSGKPFYLTYNPTTQAVMVTQVTIKVRDYFGVDDGLAVDNRPGSLSTNHNYNLQNQGWTSSLITTYHGVGSVYPSNAQQWVIGKDADDVFQGALLNKHDFGNTPAPKGRFILNAFDRSGSRAAHTGLGVPTDVETSYPSTVAFAFERVFYAGSQSNMVGRPAKSPNYTGFIFYSKTLRSVDECDICHSEADPTSEIDSTLVPTDGGYLNIPNSGKIHKLLPKGNTIIVFAEAGIWGIYGGESGFSGTEQQIVKITDFGVTNGQAVVDAEDAAFYWNKGGIYFLSPDEATGRLKADNITETTIQTYYNTISQEAKRAAVGSYDPINRKVQWMYNDADDYDGVYYKNRYNKELVLDLVVNAFYKNSISSHSEPSPYVAGYLETPDFLLRKDGVRTRGESVTKYLTLMLTNAASNQVNLSFAFYRDEGFRDWRSSDGVGTSFLSYLITGYETLNDTVRNKQAAYLFMHLKQTERETITVPITGDVVPKNPSSCITQAQWDWSNSPNSGKWGTPFQTYRLQRPYILTPGQDIDYGHEVVTSKSRLPGRGRSLSLYIRSDGDKDFYIYGWTVRYGGVSYV